MCAGARVHHHGTQHLTDRGGGESHLLFPAKLKGWGEALAEDGWFVGHTMKGWGPGIANDVNGKPRQLTGAAFNKRKAATPTPDISNNDYAANFTDFLEGSPKDAP